MSRNISVVLIRMVNFNMMLMETKWKFDGKILTIWKYNGIIMEKERSVIS